MANVDAPFLQQIFDVSKRKRKPDVQYDGQTDDLGAGFEIPKWAAFCHLGKLCNRPARLKLVLFQSAFQFNLTLPVWSLAGGTTP